MRRINFVVEGQGTSFAIYFKEPNGVKSLSIARVKLKKVRYAERSTFRLYFNKHENFISLLGESKEFARRIETAAVKIFKSIKWQDRPFRLVAGTIEKPRGEDWELVGHPNYFS